MGASHLSRRRLTRLLLGASIMLLGFGLLIWDLDGIALSGDEIGNVRIESGGLRGILEGMATAWSQHPPVSHLLNAVGLRLFGGTDFGARMSSVLLSTLVLALVYRFAGALLGHGPALWSSLLVATAPSFVLYGRMEKYYAIAMGTSLVAHLVLLSWLREPGRRRLVLYAAVIGLLWYTDYLEAGFVVAAHLLWVILACGRERRVVLAWAAAVAASTVLLLPWMAVLVAQAGAVEASPTADLATGAAAFVAKLAFFGYSYGVGETVFPWEVPALVAIALAAILAAGTLRRAQRGSSGARRAVLFMAAAVGVPAVGLSALSCTPLLDTVPLITLPNHVIFALPVFRALLVGPGPWRKGRGLALAAVALLSWPALVNLYRGEHYLNPAHANPSREAVLYVVGKARSGDVVVADELSLFSYYFDVHGEHGLALISGNDAEAINVCAAGHERLWLITIGRDRTFESAPEELVACIESEMLLDHCTGFGEQDATYRALRGRLTGREAYLYRVQVCLYVDGAAGPQRPARCIWSVSEDTEDCGYRPHL